MKKQTKIVILSVVFLLIATAALWYINSGGVNRQGGGSLIVFTKEGEVVAEAGIQYMRGLESETFEAVIRSSGNRPVEVEYTGVLLMDLLAGTGIDTTNLEKVIVKGLDGYMIKLLTGELTEKGIFIAYEMDGAPIAGRAEGGFGPFQLVIPGDAFSQRWCKYVCEVAVE